MERKLLVLKGVLLLRRLNKRYTKEEQLAEVEHWFSIGVTEEMIKDWIDSLKRRIRYERQ